jgi:hypothetical protein
MNGGCGLGMCDSKRHLFCMCVWPSSVFSILVFVYTLSEISNERHIVRLRQW